MPKLTICSWNVNGLRAAVRTADFQGWLAGTSPDIAGLQEVKALPEQVEAALWEQHGYACHWHSAARAGYSGALLLTKMSPQAVRTGIGIDDFDREGRMIEADFPWFTLITCYFPNAGNKAVRLDFKLHFYSVFLEHIKALRAAGRPVIFMGDLNVAHTEHDVARPQEALKGTGFLPVEREWLDRFHEAGFVDTFRRLNPDARDAYSYWDAWRERRARNVGWRIDYVFVSEDLLPAVKHAFIQADVMGSDHCPVGIELEVPD